MHCQLNDDTPLGRNNHAFTGFSRPESRNSNHINADTRAYQVPLTTDLGQREDTSRVRSEMSQTSALCLRPYANRRSRGHPEFNTGI